LERLKFFLKRHRKPTGEIHAPINGKTIAKQLWMQCQIYLTPDVIGVPAGGITQFGTTRVAIGLDRSTAAELKVTVVPR